MSARADRTTLGSGSGIGTEPQSVGAEVEGDERVCEGVMSEAEKTIPPTELRLALTLNGGVSLAVYIGGVCHELDRLARQRCSPTERGYRGLLDYLQVKPVVDIITGTSAGGINGAALALVLANTKGDFGALRSLWIERGRMESLLRHPYQSGAPSLLKGDDYFLPELRSAFRSLVSPFERSDRDIDLTITTTLLTPVHERSTDCLGTNLVQPQHAGLFNFVGSRGARGIATTARPTCGATGEPRDDFASLDAKSGSETIDAIALAARATAAFPVAFEPTFVPVNHPSDGGLDRPNMQRYASWAASCGAHDMSRYVVDGGVLANTPTRPTLQAIRRMGVSDAPVHRVLLLVHPHAADAARVVDKRDCVDSPPTLVKALTGVMGATGSVGSRSYVEEIEQHNVAAARWRDGRSAVLESFSSWRDLRALVGDRPVKQSDRTNGADRSPTPAWKLFHSLAKGRAANFLVDQIHDATHAPIVAMRKGACAAIDQWDDDPERPPLPFLPDEPPSRANVTRTDGWRWGIDLACGVAALAHDLVRECVTWCDGVAGRSALLDRATKANKVVANAQVALAEIAAEQSRDALDEFVKVDATNDYAGYFTRRLEKCAHDVAELGNRTSTEPTVGDRIARHVFNAALALMVLMHGDRSRDEDGRRDCPRLLRPSPLTDASGAADMVVRLLTVEVASYLVSASGPTDPTMPSVPIDLVQVSAQVEQCFAEGMTADDKLAGMALNRFGGFLKRSWRANDWTWGRLDAIKVLMLTMLTPDRIRQLCASATGDSKQRARTVVDEIARHTYGIDHFGNDANELNDLRKAAVVEVADDRSYGRPLEKLASFAAFGLQSSAVAHEAPALVAAIEDDRSEGASGAQTEAFKRRAEPFVNRGATLNLDDECKILHTFADSRIGQEDPKEQLPSDLLIRTAATAAATGATMLGSDRSGLGMARPVTRLLRGFVAVPYWVAVGLTRRGVLGPILTAVLMAVGVSFCALGLIGPFPAAVGTVATTVGVSALIAVFAYAAMRTRSIVHGVALLGLFIPLIPFAASRFAANRSGSSGDPLGIPTGTIASIAVFALIVATIVVANLPTPIHSPFATIGDRVRSIPAWSKRHFLKVLAWGIAALAVGVGAWLVNTDGGGSLRTYIVGRFADGPWTGRVTMSWLILLAFLVAHSIWVGGWYSHRLRPYGRRLEDGRRVRLTDPAGLAITWSALYGTLYVFLAAGLAYALHVFQVGGWWWLAPIIALALGLTLSVVTVHWLPHRRHRRLIDKVVVSRRLAVMTEGTTEEAARFTQDVWKHLRNIGERSAYLHTPNGDKLSRAGERVVRNVHRRICALEGVVDQYPPRIRFEFRQRRG